MFYHTLSQVVLQMEANTYEAQESSPHDNRNVNIMHVWDTILSAAAESGID